MGRFQRGKKDRSDANDALLEALSADDTTTKNYSRGWHPSLSDFSNRLSHHFGVPKLMVLPHSIALTQREDEINRWVLSPVTYKSMLSCQRTNHLEERLMYQFMYESKYQSGVSYSIRGTPAQKR